MSLSPLMKGNTPLMHFSFATDGGAVVPLPNDITQIKVHIHDSAGVRDGAGTLGNLNASAGTVDYLAAEADTANPGVVVFWASALLAGETKPRDFDPQKVLIEDPVQA